MRIIFICIGNTCRSVMAEYIGKQIFPSCFYIDSAGVDCNSENYYQKFTVEVINDFFGTRLDQLPSKNINTVDLDSYDQIHVLDKHMYDKLRNKKNIRGKLFCYHVDDPFENDVEVYNETFHKILEYIRHLAK